MRSFCGAQTVCLTVACEYLGKLCVLGVVKRRRSRVCIVCAVCLSAQRSSPALYVLCRAMLESGAEFRLGKCEFARVMGDVMRANSAFIYARICVLRAAGFVERM